MLGSIKRSISFSQFRYIARPAYSEQGYFFLMPQVPPLRPNESNIFMDFVTATDASMPNLRKMSSHQIHNSIYEMNRQFELFMSELSQTLGQNSLTFDQILGSMDHWVSMITTAKQTAKMFARVLGGRHFLVYLNTLNHFGASIDSSQLFLDFLKSVPTENDEQKRMVELYSRLGFKQSSDSDLYDQLLNEQIVFLRKLTKCTGSLSLNTRNRLNQIPDFLRQRISQIPELVLNAAPPGTLTYSDSLLQPILTYCPDSQLRKEYFSSTRQRASVLQARFELNNRIHCNNIIAIRQELAASLGYDSYSEFALSSTPLGSLPRLLEMIGVLRDHFKPIADGQYKLLAEFARSKSLEIYDIPYFRRLQTESIFGRSGDLRQKFEPIQCVETMLKLAKKIVPDLDFIDCTAENSEKLLNPPHSRLYRFLGPYESFLVVDPTPHSWMDNAGVLYKCKSLATSKTQYKRSPVLYLKLGTDKTSNIPAMGLTLKQIQDTGYLLGKALQDICCQTHETSTLFGSSDFDLSQIDVIPLFFKYFFSLKQNLSELGRISVDEAQLVIDRNNNCALIDLMNQLFMCQYAIASHLSKNDCVDVARELWPQFNRVPMIKHDYFVCQEVELFAEDSILHKPAKLFSTYLAGAMIERFVEADPKVADLCRKSLLRQTYRSPKDFIGDVEALGVSVTDAFERLF